MINEINIIKNIAFQKGYLIQVNEDVEYYTNSLTVSYKSILSLLKDLNSNSTNIAKDLIHLHCHYVDVQSDFYKIKKIFDYALRKNKLSKITVELHFDQTQLIGHLLCQTVDTMIHVKKTVPVIKCDYAFFEKSLLAINKFEKNVQYILDVSEQSNTYHAKQLFLYLKQVHRIWGEVYRYSILQLLYAYPSHKIND